MGIASLHPSYAGTEREPVLSEPKDRLLARLASEIFLSGLQRQFFRGFLVYSVKPERGKSHGG
jgi:hypothetical protein